VGRPAEVVITRAVLDDLAEKAGMAVAGMDGNQPIFETRRVGSVLAAEQRRRADLEREVMVLNAKVKSYQSAMKQIINEKVEGTLRSPLPHLPHLSVEYAPSSIEGMPLSSLRAEGASDEDIEATEKLLGWKPEPKSQAEADFINRIDKEVQAVSGFSAQIVSDEAPRTEQIKSLVEALRAQGIVAGSAIVHPSIAKQIIGTFSDE
jgi:hypothetical protein